MCSRGRSNAIPTLIPVQDLLLGSSTLQPFYGPSRLPWGRRNDDSTESGLPNGLSSRDQRSHFGRIHRPFPRNALTSGFAFMIDSFPVTAVANTKVCSRCRQCFATSEFRLRCRGHTRRHSICNGCRRETDRLRRDRSARRILQDGWRELRREQNTFDRVSALIDELVDRFGGLQRLVETWRSLTESASASWKIKSLDTILRIAAVVERERLFENELLLALRESGDLSLNELSPIRDDELHDVACEPLRQMRDHGVLHTLLQRMLERGELRPEDLPHSQARRHGVVQGEV